MDLTSLLILAAGFLLFRSDAGQAVVTHLFPGVAPGASVGGTDVPGGTFWRIVSAEYGGFITPGGAVHAELKFSHRGPSGTYRFGFNVAPSRGITVLPSGHETIRQTFETDVVVGDDAAWTDYSATIDAPSSNLTGPTIIPSLPVLFGVLGWTPAVVVNWFDCQAWVADQNGHVYAAQWDNRAITML